jgi:hypothetical protein
MNIKTGESGKFRKTFKKDDKLYGFFTLYRVEEFIEIR